MTHHLSQQLRTLRGACVLCAIFARTHPETKKKALRGGAPVIVDRLQFTS